MDTFLGPFSESLNIPVCDLTQSGLLADRHITVGFLYELRYKWKLKTHQDVVLAILKLKPSYLKVSGKYLKRKLNTCLNRVKLFMDRKDERLDGYLKQKFVLKIPSTQGVCTGSSTDDGLFDDLIDENESSSDAMPPPPHKISEDVCTLNSRGVFQEVDRNVTATKSLNMNVDFDNVDTDHFPATNGNSQLDLSFSASTMGRSNSRNNEALTQYLLGQGTSGSMVTQIEVKQTESKEGCSVGCVADRDQSKDEVDMNDQCDSVDSQKESNILHSPIIRDCEVRLVDTSMRDHELPNETYSSENPSACKKPSKPVNGELKRREDSDVSSSVQVVDQQDMHTLLNCSGDTFPTDMKSLGKLGCSHYPTGSLLKVICSKDSIVYNAKVLESKIVGESIYYLVHYSGWNVRYDEWIGEDCITECVLIGDGKPLQKSPKRVYPALSPKLHETGHQLENHPVSKPGACSVNRQNKRKYEELEERSESSGAEKTSPSLVDSDDSEASLKECNRDLNNGLDKTWSVKLQDYWPAEKMIKAGDLNPLLICQICKYYLFRATTVTECMHTFCRKCIYYHIERSNKCPQCKAFIDPSNPIIGLKEDKLYQQLVNKILPQMAERDRRSEENYTKQYGEMSTYLGTEAEKETWKKYEGWISLKMIYIGCSGEVTSTIQTLDKPFLLIPTVARIHHLEMYLAVTLTLDKQCKCLLFYMDYILHRDMSLCDLLQLHSQKQPQQPIVEVCYGIVPSGPDYFNLLPSKSGNSTDMEYHWKRDKINHKEYAPPSMKDQSHINFKSYEKCVPQWRCCRCGEITKDLKVHIVQNHAGVNAREHLLIYNQSESLAGMSDNSGSGRSSGAGVACLLCGQKMYNVYFHLYKEHQVNHPQQYQALIKECLPYY